MLSLVKVKSFEVILHIGAGSCFELDEYVNSGAERIILVEANLSVFQQLQNKCVGYPNVKVLHAIISNESREAQFNIYNATAMSSLRMPTGVTTLYPNLRTLASNLVITTSIETLISEVGLDGGAHNLLVIDAPGEEYHIINKLEQTAQLGLFSNFIIYAGYNELYHGSESIDEILKLLIRNDYKLGYEDKTDDPDRPHFMIEMNQLKLDFLEMQRQNAALRERIELIEGASE